MSKVRTLSRTFMKGHPREGEPTYFVEMFLNTRTNRKYNDASFYLNKLLSLNEHHLVSGKLTYNYFSEFVKSLNDDFDSEKPHTIRGGHPDDFKEHFKKGDKVSIRCWSGAPYNSPQIILWDDVELKEVYEIMIFWKHHSRQNHNRGGALVQINNRQQSYCRVNNENEGWRAISENDGLSPEDMKAWFSNLPFKGQILVWGDVKY